MRNFEGDTTETPAALRRLAVLFCLVTACSGARTGGESSWRATTDTIGDTIVVRTTAGSTWESGGVLVPETTIGVLEGDEAYMLGSIRGIAVSTAGEIYAFDSQVPVLRKYGPDGRHIANFGREGGGPGEYKNSDGGLAVLSDGRMLLRDPGNARINVYAANGTPIGDWRLPSGGGFNTSRKLYRDTADNVYPMLLLERDVDVTRWTYGLARIRPDGSHRDTLRAPVWDYETPVVVGRSENSSSSNSVPFSPSKSWALSPFGYMVGGLSTDYRIELFRPGERVLRIERAWEPVAVGAAEKANAEERIILNMRHSFPGWRWNGPAIPDAKPPFRGLYVGDDGRLWVQLSQPAVEILSEADARAEFERTERLPQRFEEPVVFDVFEPDGRYLGRVDTPDGFSTGPEPVFRGENVWAIMRDENDVSYIVRFRLLLGESIPS